MAQLSKGSTFSPYPTGNYQVTADLLNQLVDNATLKPGAISEQAATTAAVTDYVLLQRPSDPQNLYKTTIQSIVNNYSPPTPVSSSVPIGTVMMWATTTPPTDWLECNGNTIPTIYTALRSLIGTTLPDLRGVFVRGLNRSRPNMDPAGAARTILSFQDEDFKSHNHYCESGGATTADYLASYVRRTNPDANTVTNLAPFWTNNTGGPGADDETRPVNVALLYIIKAQ